MQLNIKELRHWDNDALGELFKEMATKYSVEVIRLVSEGTTRNELAEKTKPLEQRHAREFFTRAYEILEEEV